MTGLNHPPRSAVPFCRLPENQQIGGYPTAEQVSRLETADTSALDVEGRCIILEFPAFVLLGVYSPANSSGDRDDFRMDFLRLLDARIRNLRAIGKRVVVMGDLNVARTVGESAHALTEVRKKAITKDDFTLHPARVLFNQLMGGPSLDNDDGVARNDVQDSPFLLDLCREFQPRRQGMYTCWDQKKNSRPGNFGARIDYVLCSADMKDWFSDSNIQEGLMVRALALFCSDDFPDSRQSH